MKYLLPHAPSSFRILGKIANDYERTEFVFASNSMAACIDYALHSDAFIEHTHLIGPSFQKEGLVEVELVDRATEYVMGLYVLDERYKEPSVADLVDQVVEAGRRVLPNPVI